MRLNATLKASLWIVIGVFFGFFLVLSIKLSSALFRQQRPRVVAYDILSAEFISFLCLALLGGAMSDYVLSMEVKWEHKLIVILLVLVFCVTTMYVFNPASDTIDWVKRAFSIICSILTILFCFVLKSAIYTKDNNHHQIINI